MRSFKIFTLAIVALVFSVGCTSQYEMMLNSSDVQSKYEYAMELFEAGKYRKSGPMFESLTVQMNNEPQEDTVCYYWALSNYRVKDFINAEANFNTFINTYFNSPFVDEASFLRLDCQYRSTYRYELDQTPTQETMISITEYLAMYPDSKYREVCEQMMEELQDRLDKKEFESARLYYKMEDYIASMTALSNLLKDNPDNHYREEAMYYLAKSSYRYAFLSVAQRQKDRYMAFADNYLNFIGEYPESTFRPDLDHLYERYQKSQGESRENNNQRRADKKAEKEADKIIKMAEKAKK